MVVRPTDGSVSGSQHTDAQLARILANYKLTPMTLAMKLNPKIIPAPFLNYISAKVAHAIAKGGGRLIISLPPRHGKSELITKNTPIWTLENYGAKNVILCTYGGELSTDFGRKVRDLVTENEDLLNIRLKADAQRVNNWHTNFGGAMMSVGLGGPITGRGADVLLIDDYIKEIKESLSASHREYIWEWFITTAFTRLEPGGTCIIIATRWHEDDLIGRILKNNPGGNWENIVIPALAEPEYWDGKTPVPDDWRDRFGRKFGDALFPERYAVGPGPNTLLERKETLGTYFFNALFQQRPEDPNAKLTDKTWLKYLSHSPQDTETGWKWGRYWDLAATEDGGDWMVGSLIGYHKATDRTCLANIERAQLSPGGVEELVAKIAARDGPNVRIRMEQEPGSSGKLLTQAYQRLLKDYDVDGIPVTKNKVVRAQPVLAAIEAGKFYVVEGKWNKAFVDEYDEFPAGEHDDQIDTIAAGYTDLSGKKTVTVSWGRDATSAEQANPQAQHPTGHGSVRVNSASEGEIILPNGTVHKFNPNENVDGSIKTSTGVVWGRNRTKRSQSGFGSIK